MRFYLDEDVTVRLVALLRELGHDAIHTADVGNKSQTDTQQLDFARAQDRIVVTCNSRDFSLLHEAWSYCRSGAAGQAGHGHPGIAVVPNSSRVGDEALVEIVRGFAETVREPANQLYRWRSLDG